MEIFKRLFYKNFFWSLVLSTTLMASCSQESDIIDPQRKVLADNLESVTSDQNEVTDEIKSNESMQPVVEKIYAQVIESNAQQTRYMLYVQISNSESLPDELYVKNFALTDDGNYEDVEAGDGLYTVYESITRDIGDQPVGSIRMIYDRSDTFVQTAACKIRLVSVGKPCGGGVCPRESIFGGTTWFCVCISDCEFLP